MCSYFLLLMHLGLILIQIADTHSAQQSRRLLAPRPSPELGDIPHYPSPLTMPSYSYLRLRRTLSAFRLTKQSDNSSANNIQVAVRANRRRRAAVDSHLNIVHTDVRLDESDVEDDDYAPGLSAKKVTKPRTGDKRKAVDAAGNETPSKSSKKYGTTLDKEDLSPGESMVFVTLQLPNHKAELSRLAHAHENNVKHTKKYWEYIDTPEDNPTFTERLDREAAEINNDGGKALRSRLIPDKVDKGKSKLGDGPHLNIPPIAWEEKVDEDLVSDLDERRQCRKCKLFGKKCVCHEALMCKDAGKSKDVCTQLHDPSANRPLKRLKHSSKKNPQQAAAAPSKTSSGLPTPSASESDAPLTSDRTLTHRQAAKTSVSPPSIWQKRNADNSQLQYLSEAGSDKTIFMFKPLPADEVTRHNLHTPIVIPDDNTAFEIITRWHHPIDFRSHSTPCRFCTDFTFGIYGEKKRAVKVFRDPQSDCLQFIEGDGMPPKTPTQMCVSCSLDRRYIMVCRQHKLSRIAGIDEAVKNAYAAQMMRRAPTGSKPVHDVCSLCFLPADYRCCAEQQFDKLHKKMARPNDSGCGLRLCIGCFGVVREHFPTGIFNRRKLQKLLQEKELSPVMRADVEFICERSLLMEAYRSHRRS